MEVSKYFADTRIIVEISIYQMGTPQTNTNYYPAGTELNRCFETLSPLVFDSLR
jgi:DUF917 family protein